jgi:hypothetical protein
MNDNRSKYRIATLDRKTQSIVLCGACGMELARVERVQGHKDLSMVRVLYINWVWRPEPDGVFRLPPRQAKVAKERGLAHAWVRHAKKIVAQLVNSSAPFVITRRDFGLHYLPGDPEPENVDETSWLAERGPQLPITMECYSCRSIQLLTVEKLRVEETLTGEAPYPEIAQNHGFPQTDNRKVAWIERKRKA